MEYSLSKNPVSDLYKKADSYCLNTEGAEKVSGKEKLFRDILMTNMSISELAEKYKFTTNYITTFCRKHFGKSPKELRMEYKE